MGKLLDALNTTNILFGIVSAILFVMLIVLFGSGWSFTAGFCGEGPKDYSHKAQP